MLAGPIVWREYARVARRGRSYLARSGYGLFLLALLVAVYAASFPDQFTRHPRPHSVRDFVAFTRATFLAFILAQGISLVVHVPSLVAPTIAEEARRKTLGALLASRMGSRGIVLEHLAARWLFIAAQLGIALPVLLLLTLLGGIDARLVALALAATASTAFFVSAVAIAASVGARGVHQAVLRTYGFLALWLLGPVIVAFPPLRAFYPGLHHEWLSPVNDWLLASNPLTLVWSVGIRWMITLGAVVPATMVPTTGLEKAVRTMAVLQAVAGCTLLAWAVWRLRPAYRRNEDGRWARRGRKEGRRPECGDDPMFWKERHFGRAGVVPRRIVQAGLLALAATALLLNPRRIVDDVTRACHELLVSGYTWSYDTNYTARGMLNFTLRCFTGVLSAFWLLAVTCAGAVSVSSERDEGTWDGLATCPLTPAEIVRSKLLGAVWVVRGLGGLVLAVWVLGLALGAVHPVGLLVAGAVGSVLTWFAAAAGVYASLKSGTSTRALGAAVRLLVVVHAGFVVYLAAPWSASAFTLATCPAMVEAFALGSYRDIHHFTEVVTDPFGAGAFPLLVTAIGLTALGGYALGAAFLTRRSIAGFGAFDDRPRGLPRPFPHGETR